MEYKTSQIEITRRKRAYLTLSTSLMLGLFLSSLIFNYSVGIGRYLLVATSIFLLGAFSFSFLRKLTKTTINLSSQTLERVTNKVSEKYLLNEIEKIKIKWTANNAIREIYIYLNNGKSIFISALDNFEAFKKDLLDKLDKNITIKEMHEPLDFDHPLFYSLLGLPISTIGVLAVKLIPYLNYQHIKFLETVFSIYLLALGIYFIAMKPLSKRYGDKTVIADYLIGLAMIGLGIVLMTI